MPEVSLWTTLVIRPWVTDERPTAIVGFDETFLAPFARRPIEATTTRATYRIPSYTRCEGRSVIGWSSASPVQAKPVLQPFVNAVVISERHSGMAMSNPSFSRRDRQRFLSAFVKMTYVADQALRDLLVDMERPTAQARSQLVNSANSPATRHADMPEGG